MNDNDDNDSDNNNNKHFLLQEEQFQPRSRDNLKIFGSCGWGHIHTKADRSCAGTKIMPDRICVHISKGDFEAISVTERSCAHVSPSIKWSVTYRIYFFCLASATRCSKFKNLRRVRFKCTASVFFSSTTELYETKTLSDQKLFLFGLPAVWDQWFGNRTTLFKMATNNKSEDWDVH